MKGIEEELVKSDSEIRKHIINIVREHLKSLMDNETPENKRDIVCPYFRDSGECPDCEVCSQPEETLDDCTEDYKTLMKRHPSTSFKKEYWKNKVRDKILIDNIDFLGLNCEVCYIRDSCPEQMDGSMCSIDWSVSGERRMNATEVLDFMIGIQMGRIKRAQLFEQIDGGMPDENLSKELEKLRIMNGQRINMLQDKFSLRIEATGNSGQLNNGGGILSKIFGFSEQKQIPENSNKTIDIPHKETTIRPRRKSKLAKTK